MMEYLAESFKSLWIPGSATFFIFCLILGALLLHAGRRSARWAKKFLLILAVMGYLLSTPLFATSLVQILSHGYAPLDTSTDAPEIDAVVILGGGGSSYNLNSYHLEMLSGSSSLRLLEGMRLYDQLAPEWIIVSGGTNIRAGLTIPESETMAALLIQMGVPPDRILIEGDSANTHEQAMNIPLILEAMEIDQYMLVTSPMHMRRADLSFRAVSSAPLTSTAPALSDSKPALGWSPLPNADALGISRNAIREIVGLAYYFLQGWI